MLATWPLYPLGRLNSNWLPLSFSFIYTSLFEFCYRYFRCCSPAQSCPLKLRRGRPHATATRFFFVRSATAASAPVICATSVSTRLLVSTSALSHRPSRVVRGRGGGFQRGKGERSVPPTTAAHGGRTRPTDRQTDVYSTRTIMSAVSSGPDIACTPAFG